MDLTTALRGRKPGEWVVLDKSRTMLLVASRTPEAALEKLRTASAKSKRGTLLLQVRDPNTFSIY